MNIVFLDVDGVLAYNKYRNKETADIDVEKVKMLKEICDKGNANVVIISSWRNAPKMYQILTNILSSNGINVLDAAPHIECEYEGNTSYGIAMTTIEDLPHFKLKFGTGRAAEVQKWIEEHDTDNFVILDDEDWDWADYGYDKHWIQPVWFGNGGLQREHIEKAFEILQR